MSAAPDGDPVAGPPIAPEGNTPPTFEVLATAPARLVSITSELCEAPEALWASVDPPGDLEWVTWMLFGDTQPATIDRIARGNAVMGVFTRGSGTVFNAGSANWAYGLGADPTIEHITANVIARLSE